VLSEKQELNTVYPLLTEPKTARVKYRKVGHLQYISHLDLQRTISRVLVRAGIPMWYTQGFNPHAKVVFGLPLSVGAQSECEYVDLRIDRDMPASEIKERLNAHLTEEMRVEKVYFPDVNSSLNDIGWAEYGITVQSTGLKEEDAAAFAAYLTASPLLAEKQSKSGIKTVDIAQLVKSIDATFVPADGDTLPRIQMTALLSASDTAYLNPELLIKALRDRFGILAGNPLQEAYSIVRLHVFRNDGKTEFH